MLAGWERSQYDDKPGPSLGVIINPDRVVVVTGVSSGIGAAVARVLAGRGCHVFGRRGPGSHSCQRLSWSLPQGPPPGGVCRERLLPINSGWLIHGCHLCVLSQDACAIGMHVSQIPARQCMIPRGSKCSTGHAPSILAACMPRLSNSSRLKALRTEAWVPSLL